MERLQEDQRLKKLPIIIYVTASGLARCYYQGRTDPIPGLYSEDHMLPNITKRKITPEKYAQCKLMFDSHDRESVILALEIILNEEPA